MSFRERALDSNPDEGGAYREPGSSGDRKELLSRLGHGPGQRME